jgi:hypothetical protein
MSEVFKSTDQAQSLLLPKLGSLLQKTDELIHGWNDTDLEVFSIGDCRAPRTVEVAISEASNLANRI